MRKDNEMSIGNEAENNKFSSLTQTAYKIIKDKIVNGELKQGEAMSISAMAKQLDISRTPITYACQKLETDKQGVIIHTITINDAKEIYELRAAIETYSAKRIFSTITKNDIDNLESSYIIQVDAVKKKDAKLFMIEDINFHKYLLKKYENSQFFSIIDNLFERAFLLGVESCKNSLRLNESLNEHRQIIDCLLNNDKKCFIEGIEKNILNGYTSLTGTYTF
jgi:DNA-binding GntR family transcriptional regulator